MYSIIVFRISFSVSKQIDIWVPVIIGDAFTVTLHLLPQP